LESKKITLNTLNATKKLVVIPYKSKKIITPTIFLKKYVRSQQSPL
jgi:hypothetical protein